MCSVTKNTMNMVLNSLAREIFTPLNSTDVKRKQQHNRVCSVHSTVRADLVTGERVNFTVTISVCPLNELCVLADSS